MVITKDQDWLLTLREVSTDVLIVFIYTCFEKLLLVLQDEEMASDPKQLLEQVLASHDIYITNGQYSYMQFQCFINLINI
jgi:hypothetical protein